jgi:site-specific recombinase XerC
MAHRAAPSPPCPSLPATTKAPGKGQADHDHNRRNIVTERVHQVLGEQGTVQITPHSFRYDFVTIVLRASSNLKLAQELARHSNTQTLQ